MTELIHGLVSGLIWSAIIGSCLIVIAAVVTAMPSSDETVGNVEGELEAVPGGPQFDILDFDRFGRVEAPRSRGWSRPTRTASPRRV
jgi:hypothetical protein